MQTLPNEEILKHNVEVIIESDEDIGEQIADEPFENIIDPKDIMVYFECI